MPATWGAAILAPLIRRIGPVTVREPDFPRHAATEALGPVTVETPGALAASADLIFATIPDDAVLEAVVAGADGLTAAARTGIMFVDLSTVSHEASARVAAALAAAGIDYLLATGTAAMLPRHPRARGRQDDDGGGR